MDKRGAELATNTIIMIILGLIVLVIIILVVRQQITKGAEKYEAIGKEAEIKAGKCDNIILGRACSKGCVREKGQKEIYSPTGSWDCPPEKPNCCEAI